VARSLMMLVLTALFGAPAFGETAASAPGPIAQYSAAHQPAFNLRLPADPLSIDRSAIGSDAILSGSYALGFAVVRTGPKMPDARLYGVPHSRSPAVRFQVRF